MNESALILSAFENRLKAGLYKNIYGPRVRGISPVGEEKVYGRK